MLSLGWNLTLKLGVVTSPGYFLSSRQSCMSQSSGSDEMNDWPVCSICKVKKKYAYFIVSYFFTLLLFFFSKHRPEFGTHATTWRGVRVRGLSRLRCLERVRVWCLAQGYHGSAQEVNWHQFFFSPENQLFISTEVVVSLSRSPPSCTPCFHSSPEG